MTSFPEDYHTVPSFSYLWTTLHRIYDPLPANMDQKKALAIRASRALEKRSAQSGSFQYFGDLSAVQRAQMISRWIFDHVPGSQASPQFLMDRLPTVHAATIVIAHLCRERLPNVEEKLHLAKTEDDKTHILWDAAWEYQCQVPVSAQALVDVDLECLGVFERRLFEYSDDAGPAGNQQWGLDVGNPQGHINHYHEEYSRGRGEGSDEDVIVNLLFHLNWLPG